VSPLLNDRRYFIGTIHRCHIKKILDEGINNLTGILLKRNKNHVLYGNRFIYNEILKSEPENLDVSYYDYDKDNNNRTSLNINLYTLLFGGSLKMMIPKNTILPITKTETFITSPGPNLQFVMCGSRRNIKYIDSQPFILLNEKLEIEIKGSSVFLITIEVDNTLQCNMTITNDDEVIYKNKIFI
jgi:hypothetical protein